MKKNIILFCVLLSLCLCFMACGNQPSPEPTFTGDTHTLSDKSENGPTDIVISENPTETQQPQRLLHVSNIPYEVSYSGNEQNTGGYNEDDLTVYVEDSTNGAIALQILGEDVLMGYLEELLSEIELQDEMNIPGLYRIIHHFNISLETLLEASYTGYGVQYDKDNLRAMYLPYEEMLEAVMLPTGAYLNGNVYNIKTLNELFHNDKEAFAEISLDELVEFQERLEENGVEYGFNQDMVDFANQNNR